MGETKLKDDANALEMIEVALQDLQRAIAGVDRFNPMYFRAIGATLLVLALIAFGVALQPLPGVSIAQLIFLVAGCVSLVMAVRTILEANRYALRWQRAVAGLRKALGYAEFLASGAFVTIDKTRGADAESSPMKPKVLALTHAIRDARERLGLKD